MDACSRHSTSSLFILNLPGAAPLSSTLEAATRNCLLYVQVDHFSEADLT